jgi:hypothetical protein
VLKRIYLRYIPSRPLCTFAPHRPHVWPFGVWILDVFFVIVGDRETIIISVTWVALIVLARLRIQSQTIEGGAETHALKVTFPTLVVVAVVPTPLGKLFCKCSLAQTTLMYDLTYVGGHQSMDWLQKAAVEYPESGIRHRHRWRPSRI